MSLFLLKLWFFTFGQPIQGLGQNAQIWAKPKLPKYLNSISISVYTRGISSPPLFDPTSLRLDSYGRVFYGTVVYDYRKIKQNGRYIRQHNPLQEM
jgi:hypothetical protein